MVSTGRKFFVWWRRAGVGSRILLFVIGSLLLGLLVYSQRPELETAQLGSSLLVFSLVNLNIALLCILIFMVGRNVVRLVFDRRKRILGSKLRMRLVFALVGLTLVPTVILYVLASGLLTTAMEGWFSNQVETSVSGAVEIAKYHYESVERNARRASERLALDLQAEQLRLDSRIALKEFLDRWRKDEVLFAAVILNKDLSIDIMAQHAAAAIDEFKLPEFSESAALKTLKGKTAVVLQEQSGAQFVSVYRPLRFAGEEKILMVSHRIQSDLSHAMSSVNDAFKEYEQLKLYRNPLRSGYLLTLALITGLILFAAIWFGFYIAKEISVPVQRLAEATRQVSRGNYDVQVRAVGDDEIAFLIRSFNSMTKDLRVSRHQAETRRVFIETILSNLALAVVAVDVRHRVTSVNAAAIHLFGIEEPTKIRGRDIRSVLSDDTCTQILPLLSEVESYESSGELRPLEKEIRVKAQGRELQIVCTAGRIIDAEKSCMGTVLLFDDITELSKAQQMSAWREVARRIAHEIKNPLTPIQLSAQRLLKRLEGSDADEQREFIQTIVENVDSIKRLANEFSNFARMPTAEFESSDLNLLVSDTIGPFARSHDDVTIQFFADPKLPDMMLDREQIRRIVINLVDNSVSAMLGSEAQAQSSSHPKITLRTTYDQKEHKVSLEISDNGPGIADQDKTRIFQPYFTTKQDGTGLGLAIVSSIVSDHQGSIRVYDNDPRGAKFVVELPVAPKSTTQRRFSPLNPA